MIPRLVKATVVFVLLAVLGGCSAVPRPQTPGVELMALEVEDISLTHANMVAQVRLFNPNTFTLKVEGVRLALNLNGVRIATGNAVGPLYIETQKKGILPVRLSSPLWSYFNLANSLQGAQDVNFHLTGDVDVGGWGILRGRLPIDRKGVIPLTGVKPTGE